MAKAKNRNEFWYNANLPLNNKGLNYNAFKKYIENQEKISKKEDFREKMPIKGKENRKFYIILFFYSKLCIENLKKRRIYSII